ncbi:hypothetical protein [Hazenella coriacea]|uniref:RelB antitoxin of RelBE toxin-antitoxin system n=1 Tax=Hazenella coriacea TaxID=1179467 RepID=A0A4R3L3I7_9BACL|nr:hypothetical protein [Hazenella coriacea]TCS92223.1 RelB antitoxin of RelBE toxin-antitoxin system [Hazenella coriacea]
MGGYLKRFKRDPRLKKEEIITSRVPHGVYEKFKNHCDHLGLTMSEAVCLLIKKEVEDEDIQKYTQEYKTTTNQIQRNIQRINKNTNVVKSKKFNSSRWKIDGKLPCPKCGTWSNSGNFQRDHYRKHGFDSLESFFSRYGEEADLMVEERKKEEENA